MDPIPQLGLRVVLTVKIPGKNTPERGYGTQPGTPGQAHACIKTTVYSSAAASPSFLLFPSQLGGTTLSADTFNKTFKA